MEIRVICAQAFYSCKCDEQLGHEGPCICRCGGSWIGAGEDAEIVAYPQPSVSLSDLRYGEFRELS